MSWRYKLSYVILSAKGLKNSFKIDMFNTN